MTSSEESFRKLSCNVLYEEEGYGVDWTFHSRCKVREKVCAMSIDCESSINAVSIELVEKLELSMTLHPQPYVMKWYSGVLKITNQVKVLFSLGKFSCEVLCDVIPVAMVSCHLLLGGLWCEQQGAVTQNWSTQGCTFTSKGTPIRLLHIDVQLIQGDYKKKLLERKAREEAKKAEAAEIFSAPVQSIHEDLKINSKPRTVSLEEGEDDAAQIPSTNFMPASFSPCAHVGQNNVEPCMQWCMEPEEIMMHGVLELCRDLGRACACARTHVYVFDPGGQDCYVVIFLGDKLGERRGNHQTTQEIRKLYKERELLFYWLPCSTWTQGDKMEGDKFCQNIWKPRLMFSIACTSRYFGLAHVCFLGVREFLSLCACGWGPPNQHVLPGLNPSATDPWVPP